MPSSVVSPPATEPVSVDDVKLHARVVSTAEDTLIGTLRITIRQQCELYLRRSLITQTRLLVLEDLDAETEIPYGPIQSITSVKYKDADGNLQTWASSNYTLFKTNTVESKLIAKSSATWPTTTSESDPERWQITYVAGYGDDAADVPEAIRTGITIGVSYLFDRRDGGRMPALVYQLWDQERVIAI